MKKRFLFALTACMLCACAGALADFDLAPYQYAEGGAVPVDARSVLVMERRDTGYDVELREDGGTRYRVSLPCEDGALSPFFWPDGRMGFMTAQAYAHIDVDKRFFFIDRDGKVSETHDLSDDLRHLNVCGNGFAGLEQIERGQRLVVLDDRGREVFHREYIAREEENLGLLDCVQDSDGTFFASVSGQVLPNGAQRIVVTHYSAGGDVLWETELEAKTDYFASVLAGDGAGGAFLVKTDDESYKHLRAFYLDAGGSVRWAKRIEAEGLILHAFSGHWDEASGSLILDGNAVSKSKGIYKTLQFAVSREGEIVSAEARDFSCRPDYGFRVSRTRDGTVYVRSDANDLDTKGTKLVLVPVAALPETSLPTLRMEEMR